MQIRKKFDGHIKLMSHQVHSQNKPSKRTKEKEEGEVITDTPKLLFSHFEKVFKSFSLTNFHPFHVITVTMNF